MDMWRCISFARDDRVVVIIPIGRVRLGMSDR